jgi:homoserine kinase type II
MKRVVSDAEVDEALRKFGRARTGPAEVVPDSVSNENYRVPCEDGVYFLRFVKVRRPIERVAAEHRVIAFAARSGIPVIEPVESPGGGTVVSVTGRPAALFRWVEGHTATRGSFTPDLAATFGDLHGRVTAALATYSDPVIPLNSEYSWDRQASIAALGRVDDLISYFPSPGADRLLAQDAVRAQMELLEDDANCLPASAFAHLPSQVAHNDIHDRNILFCDDGVTRVIDWERASPHVRAFELVRALDFTKCTAPDLVKAWVGAYSTHVPLEPGEVRGGVEMWWQNTLHNTWAFEDVFIRGQRQTARFIPEILPRLQWLGDAENRGRFAESIIAAAGA